jgi:ubiquinone/menaquinone biosynthesis C-methylase UbiE
MEQITSVPALALLKQTGIFTAAAEGKEVSLFDGISGAGIVAAVLKGELAKEKKEAKVKIVLGDNDENMISLAKERIEQEGWKDVEAKVMDANVRFLSFSSFLPSSSR